MVNSAQTRPRLTPKGERTRARIVEAAAGLIHERGVAGTTLDDVRAAAEVSGSHNGDAGPLETVVDTVLALAAQDLDREQN